MNRFVTFVGSRFDMKEDIFWGTFSWKDDGGEVRFEIPINPGEFETGQDYKITFRKFETIG